MGLWLNFLGFIFKKDYNSQSCEVRVWNFFSIYLAVFFFFFGHYVLATSISGGATYRSGCSQEHPDLKKIKKNIYLIHIRNTLNHKIRNTLNHKTRNTLELKKKKNYLFYFQVQKKKKKWQQSQAHCPRQGKPT